MRRHQPFDAMPPPRWRRPPDQRLITSGGDPTTRVLIVEDGVSYREALSNMLSKEGFEVVEAHDGATGIQFDRRGADLFARSDDAGYVRYRSLPQLRLRGPVRVIMLTAWDT